MNNLTDDNPQMMLMRQDLARKNLENGELRVENLRLKRDLEQARQKWSDQQAELGQMLNEAERANELRAERDAARANANVLRDAEREHRVEIAGLRQAAAALQAELAALRGLRDRIKNAFDLVGLSTWEGNLGAAVEELITRYLNVEEDRNMHRDMLIETRNKLIQEKARKAEIESARIGALRTELEIARARLREACRVKVDDKVDFDWALLDELRRLHENEDFHPRAAKLMGKRKNFAVVAEDEPYFGKVYRMIREHEQAIGRWTSEDEIRFRAATQPPRKEW